MASNAAQSAARQRPDGGFPIVAPSYKPSGKVGPYAFLPMFLATVVGALLVGTAYFFIAPHFNYLLATQAYLGALLGGAIWLGAKAARARSSRYAQAFAVLGTLLLFAVFHGATIWQTRAAMLDYYAPQMAQKSGLSLAATRAQMERQLTFARAARFYWQDSYADGVTISDDKDDSGGTQLSGLAWVALEACEIGFTMLIAAAVATAATTARFSETQGRWYRRKRAFAVKSADTWTVLSALQAGDYAGARAIAARNSKKETALGGVYFSRVAGEPGGWAEFALTQDKKTHLLYEAQISDDALRALGVTV